MDHHSTTITNAAPMRIDCESAVFKGTAESFVTFDGVDDCSHLKESIRSPISFDGESNGSTIVNNDNSSKKYQPTDGGLFAWLQCFSAFFLVFNSWGIVNSYGKFQTYYQLDILKNESASNLSWIGSVQIFWLLFGGIIIGPLFDKGYVKSIIITGGFLMVLGMMLTSISTVYWQFLLAQGFLVGLGGTCLFNPSVSIIPLYFKTRRNLGLGVAASGSSLGGIIYPIMFDQLQKNYTFAWTCRIIGFTIFGTMLIPIIFMRRPDATATGPAPPKIKSDPGALVEIPYVLLIIFSLFGFLGTYIPFYYVELYSISFNDLDPNMLGYLVSFLNLGSFFGRIIPLYLADKFDALAVSVACSACLMMVSLCWLAITSGPALIVFCILFGFFSGSFITLGLALVAYVTKDMRKFGARLGMLMVPASLGTLVGNPIAGAVLTKGWLSLQLFCGSTLTVSLISIATLGLMTFLSKRKSATMTRLGDA